MDDCIFCKIIKNELPSKKVYEDEKAIAFHDINPKADIHVLVVPKKHINSLIEVGVKDRNLMGEVMISLPEIARKLGMDKTGYKVVVNNGRGAGQLVMHLHFHLLGWKQDIKGWQV